MKRLPPLFALAALFLVSCPTTEPVVPKQGTPLPFDAAVTRGRLANGLTYYIRTNAKPEKRVEMRLVVNAGSLQEDDNQRGVAHLLEHLAFNGTVHFRKNELQSALEAMGMRFGNDLNASTSYDETVYRLQVPADNPAGLDTGLLILEDWAHGIVLDDAEVEKERKVVLEEWRSDRGAEERIREEHLKALYAGSRYADRRIIGDMGVIASVSPAVIRKFYTDWYRPDLMAVIVVGDVDPRAVEKKIQERFGGMKAPFNPRPRLKFKVPANAAPIVSAVTDKEATGSFFRLYVKQPLRDLETEEDYRASLVGYLFHALLSNRLDELGRKPEAPFLEAYSSEGRMLRGLDVALLGGVAKEGKVEAALEAALLELERAGRFGFTATELERAKAVLLAGIEQSHSERDKRNSGALAQEYIRHYLENEASPGIEHEYVLYKRFVPSVTPAEVNALAAALFTDKNRVLLVGAPDRAGPAKPEASRLLALFARVKAASLEPYRDVSSDEPLVAAPPAPGKVVAEEKIPELGLTVWRLSNGARVMVKPTDFKNDEIVLRAFSFGGHSLAPDASYIPAVFAADLVALSGLGKFSRTELDKKLAGIQAAVAPRIDETTEGLAGSARPKDLGTLFELVYLYFTAAKIDPEAFQAYKEKLATILAQRTASPDNVFSDTLQTALSQNHRRARPLAPEDLARLDAAASLEFYRDRFGDASDFNFFFVGNIDLAALKPLVETWLAGLPAAGRRETWRDTGVRRPAGVVEKDVRMGKDPKSEVAIVFHGDFAWTLKEVATLRGLSEVAEMRLTAKIREEEGGTYGLSAYDYPQRVPRQAWLFYIVFGTDPARVAALTDKVFAELESLKTRGPTEEETAKAREIVLKEREVNLKNNAFWAEVLKNYYIYGEHPGMILQYARYIAALTPADIQQAARRYFTRDRYVRAVLFPEGRK